MDIKKILADAKLALTTLILVLTSIIGGYTFITDTFVTKAYAQSLEDKYKAVINSIDLDTQYNKLQLVQMKLLRLENKETLSDLEKELQKTLVKQESRINTKIDRIEFKQ